MFDVIIPTYKTPIPFLKKCLESLSNQTCKEYTAWICDGTPHDWIRYDDMMKIINKYPNINYVRQTGKGASQARNQIIEMGTQPYVAFLDSDDEWDRDYLYHMMHQINKTVNPKVAVWFCSLRQYTTKMKLVDLNTLGVNEEITFIVEEELSLQNYSIVNFLPEKYSAHFHASSPIWFTCAVFKRSVLEMTELFNEDLILSEDTILLLDVLDKGFITFYFDFEGGVRHTHDFQLTKKHDCSQNTIEINTKYFDRFSNYIKDVEEDEELTIYQRQTLLSWMGDGRTLGINNRDCRNKYEFQSRETYEMEML